MVHADECLQPLWQGSFQSKGSDPCPSQHNAHAHALMLLAAVLQIKPAVRSLRAALEECPQDAYFLVTKRPDLLGEPLSMQRWLDYLTAQRVAGRSILAFLLGAPAELFTRGTLHEVSRRGVFNTSVRGRLFARKHVLGPPCGDLGECCS